MPNYRGEALKIILAVSSYWIVSICLVFLNKYFEFPIFITWAQCLITVICLFLMDFLSRKCKNRIIAYEFNIITHLKISLVSICFVGMVIFNNLTLKLIPVSYYNIMRALTTLFNLHKVSFKATICCVIVVLGFLLGLIDIDTDLNTYRPVFIGIISSLFVSLFAIYTEEGLEYVNKNQWMLQTFNNINAVIIIAPLLTFVGEFSALAYRGKYILTSEVILSIILSGILGFLIGLCTNLQIKYTSALTHNISGTAKACVQTIIAVIVHKESHSFLWWFGSMLVLFGSAFYSFVRSQEMKRRIDDQPRYLRP